MSRDASTGHVLRSARRAAGVALLLLIPLAAVVAWLAVAAPAWWRPVPASDAAAMERGAALEQGLAAAFTRVRPDAPDWSIRIRESDINDWLGTRLPAWLASRQAPDPGPVQCLIQDGRVLLGVQRGAAVVWVSGTPVARDGGIIITKGGGGIGRLPVPLIQPQAALSELVTSRPISLVDGRQIRILDLELLPGEARLRLRTEGP
ncbi:MAG: hypothetical protein RLZZ558_813 [Planctomycetota bacterium]|jgi:hypothetical protein